MNKVWLIPLAAITIPYAAFAKDIYISPHGSDNNSGTLSSPLKTIMAAQKKRVKVTRFTSAAEPITRTTVILRSTRVYVPLWTTLPKTKLSTSTIRVNALYLTSRRWSQLIIASQRFWFVVIITFSKASMLWVFRSRLPINVLSLKHLWSKRWL